MKDKLLEIGFKYNFDKSYMFKTIFDNEKWAACFYRNEEFTFNGNDFYLMNKLESEIKNLKNF